MRRPLHITPGQLRTAAQAWESGGCIALGHWAARAELPQYGPLVYGELVELVRTKLNDTTDYSQEMNDDGNQNPDHDHARQRKLVA
jgi:hypothetical protein